MPYVITTLAANFPAEAGHTVSHRAVATLEEAQDIAHQAGATFAAASITESGGTVGPLPDGTVIEVERVSPLRLASMYGGTGDEVFAALSAADWTPLIDAFNAREATR